MPTCVSEFCRKQIPDAWAFCAYCGADNRPPDRQVDITCRRHQFIARHACCIHCGEPPDEPYQFRKKVRVRMATALLTLGLLCLIGTATIHGSHQRKWALSTWVDSWWYDTLERRHRHTTYTVQRGDEVIWWGYSAAAAGILVGLALFAKFDFKQLRDRSSDLW